MIENEIAKVKEEMAEFDKVRFEKRYWDIIDAITEAINNGDIENETIQELINAIYLIRQKGVNV